MDSGGPSPVTLGGALPGQCRPVFTACQAELDIEGEPILSQDPARGSNQAYRSDCSGGKPVEENVVDKMGAGTPGSVRGDPVVACAVGGAPGEASCRVPAENLENLPSSKGEMLSNF